jgi:hypothetical protein
LKLVALRCPECNEALSAEDEHIVVTCERCGTAVRLGDQGLSRVSVSYARPKSGARVVRWRPFWVFHGRVHIRRRDAKGSSSGMAQVLGLLDLGHGSGDERLTIWEGPRDLYVPAWELSPQATKGLGGNLIHSQPSLERVPQPTDARLTPATLTPADALKMLDFIVLSIEAQRPDWLENLAFQLEVGEPALWALPFDDAGPVLGIG